MVSSDSQKSSAKGTRKKSVNQTVEGYYSYLRNVFPNFYRGLRRKALPERSRENMRLLLHLNGVRGIFEENGGVDLTNYENSISSFLSSMGVHLGENINFRSKNWSELVLNKSNSQKVKADFSVRFLGKMDVPGAVGELDKKLQEGDRGVLEGFLEDSGFVRGEKTVGDFLSSNLFNHTDDVLSFLVYGSGMYIDRINKYVSEANNASIKKDDDSSDVSDSGAGKKRSWRDWGDSEDSWDSNDWGHLFGY